MYMQIIIVADADSLSTARFSRDDCQCYESDCKVITVFLGGKLTKITLILDHS